MFGLPTVHMQTSLTCTWGVASSSSATPPTVTFTSNGLSYSTGDYITVYNGPSTSYSILGTLYSR